MLNNDITELFIDVSDYEAPQPFEEVVQLLKEMSQGEYIHMLHRKQPLPLIQFLQENGFESRLKQELNGFWAVFIWRKNDHLVGDFCIEKFSI